MKRIILLLGAALLASCTPTTTEQKTTNLAEARTQTELSQAHFYVTQMQVQGMMRFLEDKKSFGPEACPEIDPAFAGKVKDIQVAKCVMKYAEDGTFYVGVKFTNGLAYIRNGETIKRVDPAEIDQLK